MPFIGLSRQLMLQGNPQPETQTDAFSAIAEMFCQEAEALELQAD